jgi:hypothetical protein
VCGYEQVPIVQMGRKGRSGHLLPHLARILGLAGSGCSQELKSETREKILCRAYGVPTKSINNRFPLFSDDVHVVRHEPHPDKREHATISLIRVQRPQLVYDMGAD